MSAFTYPVLFLLQLSSSSSSKRRGKNLSTHAPLPISYHQTFCFFPLHTWRGEGQCNFLSGFIFQKTLKAHCHLHQTNDMEHMGQSRQDANHGPRLSMFYTVIKKTAFQEISPSLGCKQELKTTTLSLVSTMSEV